MYLAERDVDATLRFVAENSAPGSTIVFDYMSERVVRGDHDDELLKQRMAQVARWGEPVVFGLPIRQARAFVGGRGLIVAADLGPQEITRRYLMRGDGTRLGDAAWYFAICVARVPEKGAERPRSGRVDDTGRGPRGRLAGSNPPSHNISGSPAPPAD